MVVPDHIDQYAQGFQLYKQKKYEDAIPFFSRSIELNAEFAPAYNAKGICLVKIQKYEDAIPLFSQAIQLDPDNVKYKSNLEKYSKIIESDNLSVDSKIKEKWGFREYCFGKLIYNGPILKINDSEFIDIALNWLEKGAFPEALEILNNRVYVSNSPRISEIDLILAFIIDLWSTFQSIPNSFLERGLTHAENAYDCSPDLNLKVDLKMGTQRTSGIITARDLESQLMNKLGRVTSKHITVISRESY